MSELQALRTTYRSGKEALLARVQAPGFSARSVHKLLRQLAAQTDILPRSALELHIENKVMYT